MCSRGSPRPSYTRTGLRPHNRPGSTSPGTTIVEKSERDNATPLENISTPRCHRSERAVSRYALVFLAAGAGRRLAYPQRRRRPRIVPVANVSLCRANVARGRAAALESVPVFRCPICGRQPVRLILSPQSAPGAAAGCALSRHGMAGGITCVSRRCWHVCRRPVKPPPRQHTAAIGRGAGVSVLVRIHHPYWQPEHRGDGRISPLGLAVSAAHAKQTQPDIRCRARRDRHAGSSRRARPNGASRRACCITDRILDAGNKSPQSTMVGVMRRRSYADIGIVRVFRYSDG